MIKLIRLPLSILIVFGLMLPTSPIYGSGTYVPNIPQRDSRQKNSTEESSEWEESEETFESSKRGMKKKKKRKRVKKRKKKKRTLDVESP